MKKTILLVLCLSAASCASRPNVHIFNHGYSELEINKVSEALSVLGFVARPSVLEIPDEINRTSIIYPPIVQDFASIESVQNSLSEAGFSNVQLILETRGEHYYSTENIGLYLVNPDLVEVEVSNADEKGETGPQLSRIYYSDCDNFEAELNLFPQGVAILEIFEWNERSDREQSTIFDGEWTESGGAITFELFDEGVIRFAFSEFRGRDDYGRFYGVALESLENTSDLNTCDFRYITYDASATLSRI